MMFVEIVHAIFAILFDTCNLRWAKIDDWGLINQPEFRPYGQMVADASLISGTDVRAERLNTSEFFIGNQKERQAGHSGGEAQGLLSVRFHNHSVAFTAETVSLSVPAG